MMKDTGASTDIIDEQAFQTICQHQADRSQRKTSDEHYSRSSGPTWISFKLCYHQQAQPSHRQSQECYD